MLKKRFLLIFSLLCTMIFSCGTALASDVAFCAEGDSSYLYHMDTRSVTYPRSDGDICFKLQDNGEVLLTSEDGTVELLRLSPYDGSNYGVGYSIAPFFSSESEHAFYEIKATSGAHGQNVGYWIIGKKDGQWVKYVTIDDLAAAGYTAQEWHMLRSNIIDGDFVLVSSHEYIPPGAEFAYQRERVEDGKFLLFWDSNAQWFGIQCVSYAMLND